MKKLLSASFIYVAIACSLLAVGINLQGIPQLPKPAQEFIAKNFPNEAFLRGKIEVKGESVKEYEVVFGSGLEIEFDAAGNWKEIESKTLGINPLAISEKLAAVISQKRPNAKITSVSREKGGYEVELDGGAEFKFDAEFNLLGIDD